AILLISPRGDLAYRGSIAFVVAVIVSILCVAAIKFGVLPAFDGFPGFCFVLGLYFLPVGFVMARSRNLAAVVIASGMSIAFFPLLTPTNEMTYNTQQFYNASLAILVGAFIVPVVFSLIPPLPPALRARRLLSSALRDLRRVAAAPVAPGLADWESRMFG